MWSAGGADAKGKVLLASLASARLAEDGAVFFCITECLLVAVEEAGCHEHIMSYTWDTLLLNICIN